MYKTSKHKNADIYMAVHVQEEADSIFPGTSSNIFSSSHECGPNSSFPLLPPSSAHYKGKELAYVHNKKVGDNDRDGIMRYTNTHFHSYADVLRFMSPAEAEALHLLQERPSASSIACGGVNKNKFKPTEEYVPLNELLLQEGNVQPRPHLFKTFHCPREQTRHASDTTEDTVITRGDVNVKGGEQGEVDADAHVDAAVDEDTNTATNNNHSGEANLPQQPIWMRQQQLQSTGITSSEERTTITESLLPLNNKTVLLVSLIRVMGRSPMMVGSVLDCAARGLRETVRRMNNDRELIDAATIRSSSPSPSATTKAMVDWAIIVVDDSKEFKTKEIVHNLKNKTPVDADDILYIEEVQRKVFYIPIADHPSSTSTSQRSGRALEVRVPSVVSF